MPEPFSAERLKELRQRWERDPKSRAFLQLAEEYRRGGRLAEAIQVLEAGLQEHPNYLSAQVALGRCHLENGTPAPAIVLLERAVAKDPTQLVANKLLVEAYLGTGQAAKARERLDLYKLFNDRDAEIEGFEARIRELAGGNPSPSTVRRSAEPSGRPPALFDLPTVGALPEVRLGPSPSAAPSPSFPPPLPSGGEPFGSIHLPTAVLVIQSAFAEEGIFALAPSAPVAVSAGGEVSSRLAPVGLATEELVPMALVAEERAPQELVLPAPAAFWEAPAASPMAPLAPAAPMAPVAPTAPMAPVAPMDPMAPTAPVAAETPEPASATLGELYLTQGHLDEAEESFRSVLRGRPGDAVALAGLDTVLAQRGDGAEAFAPDESRVEEESNQIVGGLTARKAALLKDYLERIRRGAKRHVS